MNEGSTAGLLVGYGLSLLGMVLLFVAFAALRDGPPRARRLVAAVLVIGMASLTLRGVILGDTVLE